MAVEGEVVIAEITAVVARSSFREEFTGHIRFSPGYVTVKSPWGHQTLIDNSVQGIPTEHRVVGRRVNLRWSTAAGYHGPMFAGLPDEEKP